MTKTKLNWQNEDLSALYDGEILGAEKLELHEQEKKHMQAWSLIGATMRNELSSEVNLSLADNVAAAIAKEEPQSLVSDQSKISTPRYKLWKAFHKVGFALTQTAIAASIAMVTVIGYQTWNAEDNLSAENTPVVTLGSVNNVNLASYQSAQNNNVIRLGSNVGSNNSKMVANQDQIRNSQNQEMKLINDYIRLYVFDTASK